MLHKVSIYLQLDMESYWSLACYKGLPMLAYVFPFAQGEGRSCVSQSLSSWAFTFQIKATKGAGIMYQEARIAREEGTVWDRHRIQLWIGKVQ